MFRRRCWLALLAVLALPPGAWAQNVDATDATILVRALAYDRAIDRNGTGDLVVAVLFDPGSKSSARAAPNVLRAFKGAAVHGIGRRGLKLVQVDVSGAGLAQALRDAGAAAAYVTPGLDGRLDGILAAATAARVTTLAGSASYARRGVSIGLDGTGGRPQLYVNLAGSRAAGADLTSSLLKLATVYQ